MKKDLEYVAKVENAIAKKYGEETIQNPKASWNDEKEKEYLQQIKNFAKKERQRSESKDKVEVNGFFVSKKLLNRSSSRVCPVCDSYSFEVSDDLYLNKFDCCFECYIQWVEDREQRWSAGWRPSKELKESVK